MATIINPDDFAFTVAASYGSTPSWLEPTGGLTKREYIATQLLSGLMAMNKSINLPDLATEAVNGTDALIDALNTV